MTAELIDFMDQINERISVLYRKIDEIRMLVGPFAASLPNGSVLCQTIHGVKYFIDPDDLIMSPQMIVYRQWEPGLSSLIRHLCGPDTMFVDVGANIGYFTCLAASRIGRSGGGQVFAFEPNPRIAALLRKNLEINWSMAPIHFQEAAVADFSGTVNLHIPEAHGVNASLTSLADDVAGNSISVPVLQLDETIPNDLAVDLLKIDVEGHEIGVLRGAREVIARSPDIKVVIEWSPSQMREAGADPEEIIALLDGFMVQNADLGVNALDDLKAPAWLLDQPYLNALFLRV